MSASTWPLLLAVSHMGLSESLGSNNDWRHNLFRILCTDDAALLGLCLVMPCTCTSTGKVKASYQTSISAAVCHSMRPETCTGVRLLSGGHAYLEMMQKPDDDQYVTSGCLAGE